MRVSPIRDARKRLGITQPQLAIKVKVSQGHISGVENGKENPSPDLAKRLAKVLGIPVMEILFPEDQEK